MAMELSSTPHGTPSCMFEVGNGREIYVVSDRGLLSMDGLSLERKTISFGVSMVPWNWMIFVPMMLRILKT